MQLMWLSTLYGLLVGLCLPIVLAATQLDHSSGRSIKGNSKPSDEEPHRRTSPATPSRKPSKPIARSSTVSGRSQMVPTKWRSTAWIANIAVPLVQDHYPRKTTHGKPITIRGSTRRQRLPTSTTKHPRKLQNHVVVYNHGASGTIHEPIPTVEGLNCGGEYRGEDCGLPVKVSSTASAAERTTSTTRKTSATHKITVTKATAVPSLTQELTTSTTTSSTTVPTTTTAVTTTNGTTSTEPSTKRTTAQILSDGEDPVEPAAAEATEVSTTQVGTSPETSPTTATATTNIQILSDYEAIKEMALAGGQRSVSTIPSVLSSATNYDSKGDSIRRKPSRISKTRRDRIIKRLELLSTLTSAEAIKELMTKARINKRL